MNERQAMLYWAKSLFVSMWLHRSYRLANSRERYISKNACSWSTWNPQWRCSIQQEECKKYRFPKEPPQKRFIKTSQELRMLSSVTLNCHEFRFSIVRIVINVSKATSLWIIIQSVTQWVSEWQCHLLSCPMFTDSVWTAKDTFLDTKLVITINEWLQSLLFLTRYACFLLR